MGKHVGSNIRFAKFAILQLKERDVSAIKSILANIKSLELYYAKSDVNVNLFQTICPKSTELVLTCIAESVERCKPWRNLDSVGSAFLSRAFLQQNPQIKHLKLFVLVCREYLQIIATHLPKVQQLSLITKWCLLEDVTGETILPLINLHNLTKLSFYFLRYRHLCDVLDCLKQFSTLHELELFNDDIMNIVDTEQIQQLVIALAQRLVHLERCIFYRID